MQLSTRLTVDSGSLELRKYCGLFIRRYVRADVTTFEVTERGDSCAVELRFADGVRASFGIFTSGLGPRI